MPEPGKRHSPKYKGDIRGLAEFFEDFEECAKAAGLKDEEKLKWVLKYVDERPTRQFWKTLGGYEEQNYEIFKKSVLDQYPGAKEGEKYTRRQLERLTEKNVTKKVTEQRLTEYYAKFRPMGLWLQKKTVISESEMNRHFWYGLPEGARKLISQRLDLLDPTRARTTAPPIDQALAAGRHIFSEDAFDAE
ncbi:hypothetical protein BYT27DRAFT_7067454, partial [Phlegmacium glaucopus]